MEEVSEMGKVKQFVEELKKYQGENITSWFVFPNDGAFPISYHLKKVSSRKIVLEANQQGRAWDVKYTPSKLLKITDYYAPPEIRKLAGL